MQITDSVLCHIDDLDDPGSKGFTIIANGSETAIFLVKKEGHFFAYQNTCPHTGVSLDWVEDQFLDMDGALIQCAVHGALFSIDKGTCISGPCLGDRLKPIDITVKDNHVILSSFK